ncbi:MAG: hypothetical protein HYX63_21880 [Gammaproteobacteria bacterium]|nr:hypothetical protein [Gammaproteobacteria bacterium]
MSVIRPIDLMTDLAADTEFLTPVFVGSVLKRVMPLSKVCANKTLLFEISVFRADEPGSREADVAIFLASNDALERLYKNFNNELVRFEGRSSAPEIYGFVGSYAAICIQPHLRLQCVYVQLS